MTTATDTLEACIREALAGQPRPFMEHYLYVASKRNAVVPFRFNRLQDYIHAHRTGRDYTIKYRQGGSSLYQLGKRFTWCAVIPNFTAAVVTLGSDQGESRKRLFAHATRFADFLPEGLKPTFEHETTTQLHFAETGSRLFIGTAGSREFGRSETFHSLLVTELGLYTPQEANSVLTAAMESVVPGGEIDVETTPKLIGSHAHRLWGQAKRGEYPLNCIFMPWYMAEDYFMPVEGTEAVLMHLNKPLVLTDDERKLAERFPEDGISAEDRIRWRRVKLAERGQDFFAEYPEDEASCWLSATQTVFSMERIKRLMDECHGMKPLETYGGVFIYKEAAPDRRYVIGIDAAGGMPGGDYSAGVVLCVETGEVVAVVHGLMAPKTFARTLAEVGIRYGRALIGGERDAWTQQALIELVSLGYGNLFYHEADDEPGFPNTNYSRVQGVATLREALSQGDFRCWHEELLLELAQYTKVSSDKSSVDKYGAPDDAGMHDDLCVAAQRAQQLRLSVPSTAMFAAAVGGNVTEYPSGRW
jgi:hypothetical protein